MTETSVKRNLGCKLDLNWIHNVNINHTAINEYAKEIAVSKQLTEINRAGWILKAITLIDLTTLAGDDTPSNISKLCYKAGNPIGNKNVLSELVRHTDIGHIKTAAVCVYPSRIEDVVVAFKTLGLYNQIGIASVASGFPCGQTPLKARLEEIKYAVEKGANEIDIVINRTLVLTGQWEELYSEIQKMKEACGDAHLKTILATGELGTLNNVYKASIIAMMAGADFIKTSTGKESVNATLPVGVVMARAINDYYESTGFTVGLKPAGGVKTANDAISWLILVKDILGNRWLNSSLFRFGASGLLTNLEHIGSYALLHNRVSLPNCAAKRFGNWREYLKFLFCFRISL